MLRGRIGGTAKIFRLLGERKVFDENAFFPRALLALSTAATSKCSRNLLLSTLFLCFFEEKA